MNLTLVELVAACAYLLPVGLLVATSARRETALVDIALHIPVALVADLFTTLLLTKVFALETSVFVVRRLWLAAALALWIRRRGGPARSAWPRDLPAWTFAAALAAGVLAVIPFLSL